MPAARNSATRSSRRASPGAGATSAPGASARSTPSSRRISLDGGPAARLDGRERRTGGVGGGAGRQGHARRSGLHPDQAHVVGDDVVQLTGDPRALLGDRPAGRASRSRSAAASRCSTSSRYSRRDRVGVPDRPRQGDERDRAEDRLDRSPCRRRSPRRSPRRGASAGTITASRRGHSTRRWRRPRATTVDAGCCVNSPGGTAAAATMAPTSRPRTAQPRRVGAATATARPRRSPPTSAPASTAGDGQSEPAPTPIWATTSAASTPIGDRGVDRCRGRAAASGGHWWPVPLIAGAYEPVPAAAGRRRREQAITWRTPRGTARRRWRSSAIGWRSDPHAGGAARAAGGSAGRRGRAAPAADAVHRGRRSFGTRYVPNSTSHTGRKIE